MNHEPAQRPVDTHGAAEGRAASTDELRSWIQRETGGAIVDWRQISGGNRCRSWAVDVDTGSGVEALYLRYQPPRPPSAEPYTVWREAEFYKALGGTRVPAPRLIAVHPTSQAILTERAPGRADYRRIGDQAERIAIARDFVAALATLHGTSTAGMRLPGLDGASTMADCVRRELAAWRAMYDEAGTADPLIDFALAWLDRNVPEPAGRPVLVHGDAGPGNFLFDKGRLTALLDWELAHPGDPMEDLAWFSMRCVMEPVPDFAACLREYGRLTGAQPDLTRIRYHRVFVSTRVVIIRHRNVTGLPANSIVSRALNRRLLVAALAEATGVRLKPPQPIRAPTSDRTALFDHVLNELRHDIADASADAGVVTAAKNAAKVVKFLREHDRLGPTLDAQERDELAALLGERPATVAAGMAQLSAALKAGRVPFETALRFFAASVARDGELAASASGGLANRSFPPLSSSGTDHA
ncbi:hypothetical protein GCM10007036_30750 [Alsobacter metallidurans]|uniref:Aminoglycoside phosphotransferase domain-containing protein n=1 Tax=Alsobacter metallidurans TaxID=340221 RepID=A0A917I9E5_9HYPH|nr:phosphotransferase family protein [Alsobacter metallidurans]GGH24371.1 hypothetical protein GCM10007036_30750 [Alsobacter metallidurans]